MDRIFKHLNQKNREISTKNRNSGFAMQCDGYTSDVELFQRIFGD